MPKTLKLRNKFIALLAVLLCAMLTLIAIFFIPNKTASADRVPDNYTVIGGPDDDLWMDSGTRSDPEKPFNSDLLKELFIALTGEKNIKGVESALNNSSSIADNGDRVLTSADFRIQQGGTKNVSVWFGGIKWDTVYMTKSRSGDIVLDLWQSADGANTIRSGQSAPTGTTTYLPTSQYQTHATNNPTNAFPSNMYSVSVMRVVALNAGGYTTTSDTALNTTKKSQSTSNLYAKFTMENPGTGVDSLIKYIVKPADVAYQETENSNGNTGYAYSLPNDAYGLDTSKYDGTVNFYNDNFKNYVNKGNNSYPESKYDNWKNDYLWLPSLAETGSQETANQNGMWKTNTDLRSTVTSNLWMRSGASPTANRAFYLNTSGGRSDSSATNTYAVRPALHLNLTLADENASGSVDIPTDVSNPYNGKVQTLNDLTTKPAWYDEDLYDNVNIKVDYLGSMLEVGEYTVTATLLNTEDYYWADAENESDTVRYFKYKITKAPLNLQTLRVDENGNLVDDGNSVNEILTNIYLSTSLYERDVGKSTAPQFGLQYKRASGGNWTTEKPEVAGQYYVRAYIINEDECNYYLVSDGQATFVKPKEYVETPHFTQEGLDASQIAGTTLTVQYTGDYQEFKLVNTLDDTLIGVTVGERTGGLSYDQKTGTFRAKAVGIYTVEALLEDGGANTQWDSSATELSRIITLIITKAELEVNILESDMTSWTKGDIDYLTVQVSGVKNGEAVKLDVYYQVKGNDSKTYVADSSMTLNAEDGIITVIVNLATFDSNKEYQLFVALRENISANDNYTLVNDFEPYEFFIMTATIKDEEVIGAWTISNLITGTKDAEDKLEVDYNGLAYTMSLDASKLIKGLEPAYSNESNTDANTYTTTVLLTCLPGYQLASGKSSLDFSITWKINPITFDVANLIWADNPEWSGDLLVMSIINLPIWLSENITAGGTYRNINVGSYQASYTLYSDGNYTFTYSGTDSVNNVIENNGQQATLKHDWQITKKIINVTNAPKQWTTETVGRFVGDSYIYYDIYVPAGLDENIIKVTYWLDDKFTQSVADIKNIEVDYTNGKTYYIKIEISDTYAYKDNYEMYNTLTGENFAYTSFMVGGDKFIIEVTYDSSDELQYNEQPQNITAIYRTLEFKYTYYDLSNESSPLESAPTEIGNYRVVVEVDGDNADFYWIQNNVFYFSIVKLVLNTNGYKPATGNELKESIVIAEVNVDTSKYFEYQIFDKTNKRVYEPLDYNTTYTVKLVITDSAHAVWASDAVTTYTFTTSFNPNVEPQYFNDPTITVTDNDGKEVNSASVVWTGEEFTITVDGWDELSQFATVTVNGESKDGTFTLSDVGVYEIIITLSEEAIAADIAGWLWDSGSPSKIVGFEITKRYVAIPVATGDELEYNGEMQYLFPDGYEEDYIVLGGDEVVSSVDAGEWTVILSLKNKEYSCWADGTTDDLTFTWSIAKAKIEGQWIDNDSYTEFVSEFASKLDTTYWDKDGNEVAFENLNDGESYTAKVEIKEEYKNNYEFAEGVELEHEFTFVDTGVLIISGTWSKNKDGYEEFTPNTSAFADKFTTKYYDEDGNEVTVEDMADGETYTAKISIKDEYKDGYVFADSVELEHEFTYTAPNSSDEDPNEGNEPDDGDDEDLEEKKQEAKDALDELAEEKKKEIDDNPDLTDEEKKAAKDKVDEELQKGKDEIDKAKDADGVDKARKTAEDNIKNADKKGKSFPWWIFAVIAGALALIVVFLIIIIRRRNKEEEVDDYYDDEYDYDEEDEEDDDDYYDDEYDDGYDDY